MGSVIENMNGYVIAFNHIGSDDRVDISEPHNTIDYIITKANDVTIVKNGQSGKIEIKGTDDEAFQFCAEKASKESATVLILPNSYHLTKTVTLYGSFVFMGAKPNVNIYSTANPAFKLEADSNTGSSIYASIFGNIQLWTQYSGTGTVGIEIIADHGKTINTSIFKNIIVRGPVETGIKLRNNGAGGSALIYNNRFINLKILNTGLTGIRVSNLITTYNEWYGIFVTDQAGYGLSYYGLRDSIFGYYTNTPIAYSGSQLTMKSLYFEAPKDNSANLASSSLIHNFGHGLLIEHAFVIGTNPYSYGIYMANWNPQSMTLIEANLGTIAMRTDNAAKHDYVYITGGNISLDSSVLAKLRNYRISHVAYTNSGVTSVTGDGTTTAFTVDVKHGLAIDNPAQIAVTITTSATCDVNYSFVDSDGDGFAETLEINLTFGTAPASGTVVYIGWSAVVR